MVRMIKQALEAITWWTGNAQLTDSGKPLRTRIAHAGLIVL